MQRLLYWLPLLLACILGMASANSLFVYHAVPGCVKGQIWDFDMGLGVCYTLIGKAEMALYVRRIDRTLPRLPPTLRVKCDEAV